MTELNAPDPNQPVGATDEPIEGVVVGSADDRSAGSGTTSPVVRELVRALTVAVALLKFPLLAVGVLPFVPAAFALIFAFILGGTWLVVGAIITALLIAGPVVLLLFRRSAIKAVSSAQSLEDEISRGLDLADAWKDARSTVHEVRDLGANNPGLFGRFKQVRHAMNGMQGLFERFTEFPRLRPFLPPRLPWTGYLVVASLVGTVLLVVLGIVEFVAILATAL
ncbi:hypothetical protein LWF01_09205 [Saxibacter everestensis]|uniref:Uncharacterized protein n=1 Tax=Saxibacter everestensis TaxID=2909229 RepID=A0ABY8R0F0_9MICO|nr:hypothetical protein LWF01_09205 [Brevibacteriaceae bacterium ZFBP1038]